MMNMHVRCLATALGLALAAVFIPAIAAAMTVLGIIGLVGAVGFVLHERFETEPAEVDAPVPHTPAPRVPAQWV